MQPLCYYMGRTGENNMSKYCRPMGLYVTYLDCMECEDKECIQSHRKENEEMHKAYLMLEPEQIVFLVFASKREGYKNNVVVKCKCEKATVYKDSTIYHFKPIKIVTKEGDKQIENWVTSFMCENANINTGHRNKPNRYPVFTTKEECLQWLKG